MPRPEPTLLYVPGQRRHRSSGGSGGPPSASVELDQLTACLLRLARALDPQGTGFPSAGLLLDERA